MKVARLGAVSYLNVRPLVCGLDRQTTRFTLRFDVPSLCASLLQAGDIDVGMIPSIEYLRGPAAYRFVPELGIISDGPVASVAVFSRVPVAQIRRLALDTSSRTSAALTRILCREAWGIDPVFDAQPPDAAAMLAEADAALIIGDPALFLDHRALGLEKVDLGEAWTALTGLPFVWAAWVGRAGSLDREQVALLQQARDRGVADSGRLATEYCGAARAELGRRYLRENIKYRLDERAIAGMRRYFAMARQHGLVEAARAPEFFEAPVGQLRTPLDTAAGDQ